MTGNISKSKGFKGDVGPIGPPGPQGIQGVKGDTPSIVFSLDAEGNLYYFSNGILLDKEYVASQNLVTKDQVEKLENQIGDIETALDNIIAIQEILIGGDS